MLKLTNVDAYYGNIQALRGVSLEVRQGEVVTLIGSNGAGKTTTLMAVSGVVPIQGGEITFKGRRIDGKSPDEIVALGLVQVPEGRHIFPGLTVEENLDIGAFLRRDRAGMREDMARVYDLFPILAQRRAQAGGTLSGGEQQMLAISRALMARPELLLLDEPSLGLAPLVVKRIFEVLRELNRAGTTIFLVEQNANLALHAANRAYVMENGEITIEDEAAKLAADEKVRKAYLGL